MKEENCIYVLPGLYALIILAHIFKFQKSKIKYNYWLFFFMFLWPILVYWGQVWEAFSDSANNNIISRLGVFAGIATIVPTLFIFTWMSLTPKKGDDKKRDKDKEKSDDRFFLAVPLGLLFLFVSGGAIMSPKSIIDTSLKELVGSNGWIYYVSTITNVIDNGINYTIVYKSDFGDCDYDKFGISKNSPGPRDCPYRKGDQALFRKGYGKEKISFKVRDYNNATIPTIAERIQKYHTPVLVIDHKGIHLNNVTAPSQYGVNILYKAKMVPLNYDTVYLDFKDIHNIDRRVAYNVSKIWPQIPDTFLLFNNEVNAHDFVVCAKQINTPENWKMISDYGYIFDYDIFSKEEIEDRFPEVKKYAEELKAEKVINN